MRFYVEIEKSVFKSYISADIYVEIQEKNFFDIKAGSFLRRNQKIPFFRRKPSDQAGDTPLYQRSRHAIALNNFLWYDSL